MLSHLGLFLTAWLAVAADPLLDVHGDPLPPGAVARLGSVRLRHAAAVSRAAFSPDGKVLASTGADGAVRLWDPATGKLVRVIQSRNYLEALAWAPDGQSIAATGHRDGTIYLWDAKTGKSIRTIHTPEFSVIALAFSPGGKVLASGSHPASVRLWDPATGREVRKLSGKEQATYSLAFSPEGKTLAAGGDWGAIQLYDVAGDKEPRLLKGHKKVVWAIAFSPDGKALASVGQDGTFRLWDAETSKEIRQFRGHDGRITAVAFAPDGKLVASGGQDDGTVRLWDPATGKEVRTLGGHKGAVVTVAFSPDGKILASGAGNALYLWDTATGRELLPQSAHEQEVHRLAFAPDGKTLASTSADNTARLWSLATGKELRRFPCSRFTADVFFSSDGKTLAVGTCPDNGGNKSAIVLWDAGTGTEKLVVDGTHPALFSPDGLVLIAGTYSHRLVIYDVEPGEELCRLPHDFSVTAAAAFPDGKSLASVDSWGNLYVWEVDAAKLRLAIRNQTPQASGLTAVAVAPDGRIVATGGKSRGIELWDPATGKLLRVLAGHRRPGEPDRFGRDGKMLGEIHRLAFSPDGRSLASAAEDDAVIVWEMATGLQRLVLRGHGDRVNGVAFAPDGKTLASGGIEGTVLVWDVFGLTPQKRPLRLGPAEPSRLWEDLAGADAIRAYRAIGLLAGAPREAVPFLKARLHAVTPADPARVSRFLDALDSDDFAAREQATQELERLAEAAESALRMALTAKPSAETKRRVQELLDRIALARPSGYKLAHLRAVEALEHGNTEEARHLLGELAKGLPAAELTRQSKASLERLTRKR